MKNVFCFEVKTTGVFGDVYRIAAVVYNEIGNEVDYFVANCQKDNFVASATHSSYLDMLKAFSIFYLKYKDICEIVVHLALPSKCYIFKNMFDNKFIGLLDMPYPLIDISGNLKQAGHNPISVEPYNSRNGINVSYLDNDGINNPLYYSRAVALCYIDLYKKISVPCL